MATQSICRRLCGRLEWFAHFSRCKARHARQMIGVYASGIMNCLFSRPVLLIGLGGFVGSTLGYMFSLGIALLFFALINSCVVCCRLIWFTKSSLPFRWLIIWVLMTCLGLYCLSSVCIQKYRAYEALSQVYKTEVQSFGDVDYEGSNEVGQGLLTGDVNKLSGLIVKGSYSGYITSTVSSKEGYQVYTMLWNHIPICFGSQRSDLKYGLRVRIYGSLALPATIRNPGGFDQRNYYNRKGVFLFLETYDDQITIMDEPPIKPSIIIRLQIEGLAMGQRIISLWKEVLSSDESALLSGMVLGDTKDMSKQMKSAFQMCNLTYLTAVSGAQVTYFLLPISAFMHKVIQRRSLRRLGIAAFLIFFGFLAGWTSSVTRAIFMSLGTVTSAAINKKHDHLSGLFLTGALLMLYNPFVAVDLGFLLSFSATLSLVLFAGTMGSVLTNRLGRLPIPKGLVSAAACFICIQVGMLPWLMMMSGKESIFLFAINLLCGLLLEGICLLSMPLTVLLVLFSGVPYLLPIIKVFFMPLSGLLYLLAQVVLNFSKQSVSALRLYTIHPLLVIAVAGLLLTLVFPKGFARRNLRIVFCCFVVCGLIFQVYGYWKRPLALIIFADVGQGDSALILLDNNKSVLIDGGDKGKGTSVLMPLLNYYGICEPDITILTHLHKDHGMGLLELMKEDRISSLYTTDAYETATNNELTDLFQLAVDKKMQLISLGKNDKIVLSNEVSLRILSPQTTHDNGGNEDSLIVACYIGEVGILFMGDAGEDTELNLIEDDQILASIDESIDVLKVGHHGSRFSTTHSFLSQLPLQAAVISVGRNNYGHPTREVLDRLANQSATVYRTDRGGAVIMEIKADHFKMYSYGS